MKPKRPERENPQGELFKRELTKLIDMDHPMVLLAQLVEWQEFDDKFEPLFCENNGRPGLPTRPYYETKKRRKLI